MHGGRPGNDDSRANSSENSRIVSALALLSGNIKTVRALSKFAFRITLLVSCSLAPGLVNAGYVSALTPPVEASFPSASSSPLSIDRHSSANVHAAALSGLPAAGQIVRTPSGGLTLTGSSTGVNVFEIDATTLANATSLTVATPPGAKAVMRVTGDRTGPDRVGPAANGPVTTLVSLVGNPAGQLSSAPTTLGAGSVPLAPVTIMNAHQTGPLFANAMDQEAIGAGATNELRARLAVPEPPSFALLLAGLVMLLGIIVRRRRSAL